MKTRRFRAVLERLDAVEAELAELRETNPGYWTPPAKPAAVSEPLDFTALNDDLASRHAHYVEDGDEWGPNVYI